MATTSNKILLPYLENTGLDGINYIPPKNTPYIKRIHNIDIKPALSGETIPTSNEWTTKEPEIRQDFIWVAGPTAIETITKGEFNTDPDTINTETLIQLFKDYYMAKRNTYRSRGEFFWTKQEENETPEEHWQKLVSLEKNCEFKDIKQKDLLISTLECTGKPCLLKAQHSAFNISDSTTIALTVQNWQITSFVPDSTDLVVDCSNKCLAVRTVGMQRCPGFHKNVSFAKWTNQIAEIINFLDSTTLCLTRYAASLL